MDALNRAYRVEESRAWWLVRLQAIGLVVGLSAFMIVAFVLGLFGGPIVILITSYFGPAAGLASTIIRWVPSGPRSVQWSKRPRLPPK